ncbi:MAG: hypothetical protein CVV44_19320 [Spirochaetae bacterium HGW-Spirochaetae-1]|jgi:hypothetical protein|nr:MAG: hypothetical protein CVV44_19320 [Spirochaetae bacterium HGW-Spirochaetae-1]
MKRTLKGIFALFIVCYFSTSVFASKIPIGPDLAFGLGGSFGVYNALAVKGDGMKYHPDFGYQGGLIMEKMFSNRYGIHTGFWFTYGTISFDMTDTSGTIPDAAFDFMSVSVPALFIFSFNAKKVSLNLLSGFTLNHFIYSHMRYTDSTNVDHSSDVLHYLNYVNVAVTAGFNIKFHVSQFSDFFIGILGDFNCLEMLRDTHGDDMSYVYSGRVISGVMFRTDIFPMMKRK